MTRRWIIFVLLPLTFVACQREPASPTPSNTSLPFRVAPDTTGITTPLRADGTPDYLQALNDLRRGNTTPETNGFPLFLQVLGTKIIRSECRKQLLTMAGASECPPLEPRWEEFYAFSQKKVNAFDYAKAAKVGEELTDAGTQLWKAADFPIAAEYLKTYQRHLDLFTQAAERRDFWIPLVASDRRSITSGLKERNELAPFRQLANAFSARATLRAQAGDVDGFIADALTLKKLARHQAKGRTMIDLLVAVAVENKTNESIAVVVGGGKLSEAQCRRLTADFASLGELPAFETALDPVEKWQFSDTVVMAAMGENEKLRDLNAPESWMEVDHERVDWNLVLRELNVQILQDIASSRGKGLRQLQESKTAHEQALTDFFVPAFNSVIKGDAVPALETADINPVPGESREAYSHRVAQNFTEFNRNLGGYDAGALLCQEGRLRNRLLRLLLSAGAYYGRHGIWPAAWSDLPDISDVVFPDPYSRNETDPPKMALSNFGFRVYSVGPNGTDDGGRFDRNRKLDDMFLGAAAPKTP